MGLDLSTCDHCIQYYVCTNMSTPDDICYQLRRLIRVRMHSHYEIMHDYLNPFLGENCIRFSGYSNVETLIFNVAKILVHAILYCTIYIKNNVDLPKI